MADLTKHEVAKIRRYFTISAWMMDGCACQWYWLPIKRKAVFRCDERARNRKPIPRGAIYIGTYDRQHIKEFLDDLPDAIAIAEARRRPAVEY